MYGVMEGYLNRAVSMVMQQMSGLQTDYYRDYNCEPIDVNTNGRWTAIYGTGGLIDMKTTQKVANDQEKFVLLAISQMWEALIFSTAADFGAKFLIHKQPMLIFLNQNLIVNKKYILPL